MRDAVHDGKSVGRQRTYDVDGVAEPTWVTMVKLSPVVLSTTAAKRPEPAGWLSTDTVVPEGTATDTEIAPSHRIT